MPETSHGDPREPLRSGDATALLIIDMLNDYDHPDGDALRESARKALGPIGRLTERARAAGALIVHVNDNHGRWDAGRDELAALARTGLPDENLDAIVPAGGAPLVVKARHSVFYGSPLQYLLETHQVGRLILAGQVAEQCILYSALDAYIRHFQVVVPSDAVAHIAADLKRAALQMMQRNMQAQIVLADEVEISR